MLKNPPMTDEQLETIRDDLYAFARALIEGYLRERREKKLRKPDAPTIESNS